MKYNVYIKEVDSLAHWWYNLEEKNVQEIANAFHSKSQNFLMPGRGRVNFSNLENIAIFENSRKASDKDIEEILVYSGDYIAGSKRKKFRNLSYFGEDRSNDFLDTACLVDIKNWNIIHSVIQSVAKQKYDDGHFADAVESAFKEINKIVKAEYKKIKGDEHDGDALMRKAFSVNDPVFKLADQNTALWIVNKVSFCTIHRKLV